MKKAQSTPSFFSKLATAHQNFLRRTRLLFNMLAIGYLFFYIAFRPERGLWLVLATGALSSLGGDVFEDFRRYLYLSGRRSAHSLSGKLLS